MMSGPGWRSLGDRVWRRFRGEQTGSTQPLGRASVAADVVESTTALVCVVDLQGEVLLANGALLDLTGYHENELVGRLVFDTLVIAEDVAPARASLRQAATVGTVPPVEADWLDRWGGRHRIHMHSSVLGDRDGRAWAVAYVGTDVTEHRRLQTELRERAETDALTGLRNRAALLTALQTALAPGAERGSEPVGLLFCDLDGFKKVNDRHGHLVGDAVLIEVGRRLLALTQPPQVVSRLGGDEFLVLAPAATPTTLQRLSQAIENDLQRPFLTRHGEISIGVSVGTALGQTGDDPTRLIEHADRHMYGVKTTSSRHDRASSAPVEL
jgi:diguanylate cyclase (GGDEF)-like protein/PAS domain S-box-containing protein